MRNGSADFVDLRGFSPVGRPLEPDAAVRGFLIAPGTDPDALPADPDARVALYRSLVAGRRVLVVLDNAATADQVVPLLPGSPTCAVLVTGRTALPSLMDRHGAHHLPLDVLTPAEARALLTTRLGRARVDGEPGVTDQLVGLCGRHPPALAITARHAATRPHIPLAEFAAELRDLGLEALDDTDPTARRSTRTRRPPTSTCSRCRTTRPHWPGWTPTTPTCRTPPPAPRPTGASVAPTPPSVSAHEPARPGRKPWRSTGSRTAAPMPNASNGSSTTSTSTSARRRSRAGRRARAGRILRSGETRQNRSSRCGDLPMRWRRSAGPVTTGRCSALWRVGRRMIAETTVEVV
ncbi:hypothetical protein [Saccharothrix xinjiangensis]|uniref:NB-ARC domain-containing protein n=1 Tax=Saccharothrix xinjiangensis TaxID=204798 RepID=A0ABV9YDN1_9PSEU